MMSVSHKSAPASSSSSSAALAAPVVERQEYEKSPQQLSQDEQAGAARAAEAGITAGQAIMASGLAKKAVFAVGGVRPYCKDWNFIQLVNPLPKAHLGNFDHLDEDTEDIKRYFGKIGHAIRSFPAGMPCDEVRRDSNSRLYVIVEADGGTVGGQMAAFRDEVRDKIEEAGLRARKRRATIDKGIEDAAWALVDAGIRVWFEVHAADENLCEDRVWANQMLTYVGMAWAE
ncbi:hypothetical protein BCR44DRAFT_300236 [Catenaria anguillulae PL171]|uniref:Uncharacterized protein n=1 Tax=Catenaria anguillulae PL171 TaxID=765915 RepID=A0A1Y2HFY8_9FUNG|nr:hypothetical protein BCR44DRAFT_300236 [Catenaria anguillulae PL171]